MYFRINHKLINIQRNQYNTDEEFYEAILSLHYKKINTNNTLDKLFSMSTI
jgi:hypothetical protein